MKAQFILSGTMLFLLVSCSEWNNNISGHQERLVSTPAKTKRPVARKKTPGQKEISGTLSDGTLYEVLQDPEGHIVSFDPYLPKDDHLFMKASAQVIQKIYNDSIKNEGRISIQTDIGYTILEGTRSRYKIIPYKEENGDISTLSIVVI